MVLFAYKASVFTGNVVGYKGFLRVKKKGATAQTKE